MQEVAKKKRKGDIGANIFFIVMMALPVLQFIIFYIIVNFNSILLAFQNYNNGFEWLDEPFHWFEVIFHSLKTETQYWIAFKNSFILCALSIFIVMPITLLFAYYIYKEMPAGGFFKIMLFGPSIITSVVWVLIFRYFMDFGLPAFIETLTGNDIGALVDKDRFLTITIFYLIFAFGSCILLYINAMSQISVSLLESAQIDGASELRSFFSVVIPCIWPTIVSFLIINLSQVAVNQANLHAFFAIEAGVENKTIGYHLFFLVAADVSGKHFPIASAWGLLLTFIVAPLTALVRYLATKFGPSDA